MLLSVTAEKQRKRTERLQSTKLGDITRMGRNKTNWLKSRLPVTTPNVRKITSIRAREDETKKGKCIAQKTNDEQNQFLCD